MFKYSSTLLILSFILILSLGSEVRIGTARELIDFSTKVNKGTSYSGTTVLLDSDIDLNGIDFEPIGKYESTNFNGVFDGQGHTISNLIIDKPLVYVGLFSFSNGMTLKNIVLDGSCSVKNSYNTPTPFTGSLIGRCIGAHSQCM